jgi:hypothetical protein
MSFSEIVEQHFPYDGPHSADTVQDALRGARDPIRYANNATGLPSVLNGPSLYRSVGATAALVHGLDQLLNQFADAAHRLGDDPTAYDDRHDRPASTTANDLANHLVTASGAVAALAGPLAAAHTVSSRIGHES